MGCCCSNEKAEPLLPKSSLDYDAVTQNITWEVIVDEQDKDGGVQKKTNIKNIDIGKSLAARSSQAASADAEDADDKAINTLTSSLPDAKINSNVIDEVEGKSTEHNDDNAPDIVEPDMTTPNGDNNDNNNNDDKATDSVTPGAPDIATNSNDNDTKQEQVTTHLVKPQSQKNQYDQVNRLDSADLDGFDI